MVDALRRISFLGAGAVVSQHLFRRYVRIPKTVAQLVAIGCNNSSSHHSREQRNRIPSATAVSEFGGIQHAGVIVSDTKAAKDFYINILGFEDDSPLRPDDKLPFDGAFVRAGATQIHLMELPNPDPVSGRPEHGGRDRHVAFTISNLEPLKDRLDNAGVTYTMSKSGRAALFCRDLDGNAYEFIQQAV